MSFYLRCRLQRMKTLKSLRIPMTEIGYVTAGNEMFLVNASGEKRY